MRVKSTHWLVKACPTCTEYIRNHSGQTFIDYKHQSIRLNLSAKRGRWHHRTKLGRHIHVRAVSIVGERLDNSIESIGEDLIKAKREVKNAGDSS